MSDEPKGTVQITRVPGDVLRVEVTDITGKPHVLLLTDAMRAELFAELGNASQGHETT